MAQWLVKADEFHELKFRGRITVGIIRLFSLHCVCKRVFDENINAYNWLLIIIVSLVTQLQNNIDAKENEKKNHRIKLRVRKSGNTRSSLRKNSVSLSIPRTGSLTLLANSPRRLLYDNKTICFWLNISDIQWDVVQHAHGRDEVENVVITGETWPRLFSVDVPMSCLSFESR